tara:strand:+ start:2482 stop:2763 length:282 start_codon:yes stop_codon:yes gene_type:complete
MKIKNHNSNFDDDSCTDEMVSLKFQSMTRCVRAYLITNIETQLSFTVVGAAAFERSHNLSDGSLSKAANPNQGRQYVTLNGAKHTVGYAVESK